MKKQTGKKIMALVLAGCFSIESALFAGNPAELPPANPAAQTVMPALESFPLDASFFRTFPQEAGKIQKIYRGRSSKMLIHIQDAHMNESAQRHLAELLNYLAEKEDARRVYVEGAAGEIAHRFLSAYPDAEARRFVADFFLKQGLLHGAEYAAVRYRPDLVLNGVENEALYQENRAVYLEALSYKERNLKFLARVRRLMEELGRYTLPDTYREWQALKGGLRDGKGLQEYIAFLMREKQSRSAASSYPSLEAFERTVKLEKSFNREKAEAEWKALTSRGGFDSVKMKALHLFMEGGSADEVLPVKMAEEFFSQIPAGNEFPELQKLAEQGRLYRQLETGLWNEMESLETVLKKNWLETAESRRLDMLFSFLEIYENIFDFALTKKEAEFFYSRRTEFRPETFSKTLMPILMRTRHNADWDEGAWVRLHADLGRIEKFYALALKRDQILIQNTLDKMERQDNLVSVLITGGFHTPGIESELKKKNISYAVITPKIDSFGNDKREKARYASALRAERVFWGKTEAERPAVKNGSINDVRFQLQPPPHFPTAAQLNQIPNEDYALSLPALAVRHASLEFPAVMMVMASVAGIRHQGMIPVDYPGKMENSFSPAEKPLADKIYPLMHASSARLQISAARGRYLSPLPDASDWAGVGASWQTGSQRSETYKTQGLKNLRFTMEGGLQLQVEFPADREEYAVAAAQFDKAPKKKSKLLKANRWVQPAPAPISSKRSELRAAAPEDIVVEVGVPVKPASNLSGIELSVTAAAMLLLYAAAPLSWGNLFAAVAAYRLGLAFKKWMNEWGHITVGSLLTSGVWTWKNLWGNRTPGDWLREAFLFQKVEAPSVKIQEIKITYSQLESKIEALKKQPLTEETVEKLAAAEFELKALKKKDAAIRRGGLVVGAVVTAALLTFLGTHPYLNPMSGVLFASFAAGALAGLGMAVISDLVKPTAPGKYDCGVVVCIEPGTTPWRTVLNRLFEVIRTLDPRGGQAFGVFVLGTIRLGFYLLNWMTFTFFTAGTAAAAALSSFNLLPAALSFLPGPIVMGAVGGALSLAALAVLAISGTSGEVGYRVRVLNPKRADLATTSITAMIRVWLMSLLMMSRKSIHVLIAHVRFSTSAPDFRGTQPHSWVNPSFWKMLFSREMTIDLKGGKFMWKKNWSEVTVTHNGDNNGYYFEKFKQFITYSGGVLHKFWSKLLDWVNGDKGDTVNLSGLMKFFAAQKSFKASIRLAYFQVVMNSLDLSEKLSKKELKILTKRFEAAFSKNWTWAQNWVDHYIRTHNLDADKLDMADLPDEFIAELSRRLIQDITLDDYIRAKIPDEQWEDFVHAALTNFFRADLFYAMWQLSVKNMQESEKPGSHTHAAPAFMEPMGEGNGTFGLALLSPKFNESVFYRYINPFSVVFDKDFTRVMGGSERAVFNMKPYRYRFDMRDGEIMRVRWSDEGKITGFRVFSVPLGRYLREEEVKDLSRMKDMEKDHYVEPRPSPALRNIIRENVGKITRNSDFLHKQMRNEKSDNRAAQQVLEEKLKDFARLEKEGKLKGTQILIVGTEASKQLGDLIKKLLHTMFPEHLGIRSAYPDELATSAVDYVDHPQEFAKEFGVTEDTLVIAVSQSGRTFEGVGMLKWLGTFVKDAIGITGDRDNEMSDYLGQGRIISTYTGGIQLAEPRTHVNAALHTVINETFLNLGEAVIRDNPSAFGNILTKEHLDMLREDGEVRRGRIESITGTNKKGQRVSSDLNRKIELEGRRRAKDALEGPLVMALTALIYALGIHFTWPLFPSAFLPLLLAWAGQYGFISSGFVLAPALKVILDAGFVYFFGRIAVTRLWRLGQRIVYKAAHSVGIELPFDGRSLLHRSATPKLFIAENEIYYAIQDSTFSKMVSLGYKNAPAVYAAPINQLNHLVSFKAARGDTVISAQPRQKTRRQGSIMTPQQTRGNQSLSESVYVITIGHKLTNNSDAFHQYIELEDEDDPAPDFSEIASPEGVKLSLLQEFMHDSLERSVAEYVFMNAYSESLSFPWFTRLIAKPLMAIPIVGRIIRFLLLRFPYLFAYFPRHRTHDGTNVDTTASPTDLTSVYSRIEEFETKAAVASGLRPRLLNSRDLPNRLVPEPIHIPAGIYQGEEPPQVIPPEAFIPEAEVTVERRPNGKPQPAVVSEPVSFSPSQTPAASVKLTGNRKFDQLIKLYSAKWAGIVKRLQADPASSIEDAQIAILTWKEVFLDTARGMALLDFADTMTEKFSQIENHYMDLISRILTTRKIIPHNGDLRSPQKGSSGHSPAPAYPKTPAKRSEMREMPAGLAAALSQTAQLRNETLLRNEAGAGDLEMRLNQAGTRVLAMMENFSADPAVLRALNMKPGYGNGVIIFNFRSEVRDIRAVNTFVEKARKETPRTPVYIYRDPATPDAEWDALQAAIKPNRLLRYFEQEQFESLPAFVDYQTQVNNIRRGDVVQLLVPGGRLKKQLRDGYETFERGSLLLSKETALVIGYDQPMEGVRSVTFTEVFGVLMAGARLIHQSA